jgi:D-alanine-D-alanine ligase-like ATP-grasp enzyme
VFLQMCGPTASAAQKYVCDNKDVTRALLREAGIPLNEGAVFRYGEAGAAEDFAEALGYPVVVKPTHLSKGRGVTVGVQDVRGRLTLGVSGHPVSRSGLIVARVPCVYSGGDGGEAVGARAGVRGGARG